MFENRTDAGRRLAELLDDHDIQADIVLAIPRGGLPVGRAVADYFDLPLDIIAARKIGAPGREELAVGSVGSDGTVWLNDELIDELGVTKGYLDDQIEMEYERARGKVERYRGERDAPDVRGQRVLLVDDGVATGATTIACLRQLRDAGAARVTLGVPVAPPETVDRLRAEADEVVCVETPPSFRAVGQFYRTFDQISDEQALAFLSGAEP